MALANPTEDYSRITDPFGFRQWRKDAGQEPVHMGLDIAGESPGRTPLLKAMDNGKVIYAARNWITGRNGNYMCMSTPNKNTFVLYGHYTNPKVKTGSAVKKDHAVATMGRDGLSASTGIHVHIEVWYIPDAFLANFLKDPAGFARRNPNTVNSFAVDPQTWMKTYGIVFKKYPDKFPTNKNALRIAPQVVKPEPEPERAAKPEPVKTPPKIEKEPPVGDFVTRAEVQEIVDAAVKTLSVEIKNLARHRAYYINPKTGKQGRETHSMLLQNIHGMLTALTEAAIYNETVNPKRVSELAPTREQGWDKEY